MVLWNNSSSTILYWKPCCRFFAVSLVEVNIWVSLLGRYYETLENWSEMMLQFDTSFMYASNLFCLKLIWFCLHRKGALGDDFLLEICWTVQFPNLQTGENWKVLEDWSFWYISKFHFRSFFLTKTNISSSLKGIFLQLSEILSDCKMPTNVFYFYWLKIPWTAIFSSLF